MASSSASSRNSRRVAGHSGRVTRRRAARRRAGQVSAPAVGAAEVEAFMHVEVVVDDDDGVEADEELEVEEKGTTRFSSRGVSDVSAVIHSGSITSLRNDAGTRERRAAVAWMKNGDV